MKYNNHLIGEHDISENDVIHFPNGIIGFENHKKFIIVNNNNFKPFCWLLSLDQNDFALPLVNPFLLINEYQKEFPRELVTELKENNPQYEVFCVVSLQGNEENVTLNLKGPILVDYLRKEGKQVILADEILSVSHPLN